MQWTQAQQQAIDSRGKNIIVSASAGSGKTSVMIERIVGLLKEGASLSEMLIVTFTRASAADMKDKLARKLSTDPALRDKLKQLTTADIGTLHSWCQRLSARYFFAIGLDPDFAIIDQSEGSRLFFECMDDIINSEYEAADPHFLQLAEVLGGRGDDNLRQTLSDFYYHLAIRPDFSISADESGCKDSLLEIITVRKNRLVAAAKTLFFDTQAAGFDRNIPAAAALVGEIEGFLTPDTGPRGRILPEFLLLNDRYKALREQAKKLAADFDEIQSACPASTQLLRVLMRMAEQLRQDFGAKKRAKSRCDFNDLEHYALQILNSPAGEEVRARYRYVFVDEYQDINPLQNSIVSSLLPAQMFLVGDLKQSIYAFRGCEPAIFAQKIKDFSADTSACEVIELTANHRSKKQILQFADRVFSVTMTEEFGGSDYDRYGRFLQSDSQTEFNENPQNSGESCDLPNHEQLVNLCLYPKKTTEHTGIYNLLEHTGEDDPAAALVTARILQLMQKEVPDGDKTRPARLSDIAVLTRSGGTAVKNLASALSAVGLKAEPLGGLMPTGSPVINALRCYLRLIDNRLSDPAMINALKSHFGGFSDSELSQIRLAAPHEDSFVAAAFLCANPDLQLANLPDNHPDYQPDKHFSTAKENPKTSEISGFYSHLFSGKTFAPQIDTALKQKLNAFLDRLDHYRALSKALAIDQLIGTIVTDFCYFQYAFGVSESAAESLDAYLTLANEQSDKSLSQFLDQEPPATAEGSGDAVKIMTVHSAKGLEFPFVILLDVQKRFNLRDLIDPIILSDNLAAIKHFDMENRQILPSHGWLKNKHDLSRRQKEEEMRLLYVAITRAKYSLDIFGQSDFDPSESQENSQSQSENEGKSSDQSTCWLDWLMPIAARYQVQLSPVLDTGKRDLPKAPDKVLANKLRYNLDFRPPHSKLVPKTYVTALLQNTPAAASPASTTTSNNADKITGKILDGSDMEKPIYLTGEHDDRAAETGTLYHRAMELIDFGKDFDPQWERLDGDIKKRVDKNQIKTAIRNLVPVLSGYNVFKEQPFIIDLPTAEIEFADLSAITINATQAEKNATGSVLVQGIIDLLAIKNDKTAIVIDFKTGEISPKYKIQLDFYALAAAKILGLKSVKTYIYSFKYAILTDSENL